MVGGVRAEGKNIKSSVVGVDKTNDIFHIFQDILTDIHQFVHIMDFQQFGFQANEV